jgi:hypothetical protein
VAREAVTVQSVTEWQNDSARASLLYVVQCLGIKEVHQVNVISIIPVVPHAICLFTTLYVALIGVTGVVDITFSSQD